MKDVAIVTVHRAHNYGAVLQAYALRRIIVEMGYTCDVIDYDNQIHKEIYEIKHKEGIIRHFYPYDNAEKYQKFEDFIDSIGITENHYINNSQLENIYEDYKIWVSGSDQVWNLNFGFINRVLFFLKSDRIKKRIAYAPSFGNCDPKKIKSEIKEIEKFDYLFMREQSSVELLNKVITGKNISTVLDPTLLLTVDKWNELTHKKYTGKPYMLAYIMNEKLFPYVNMIAKKRHQKLIVINFDKSFLGINVVNASNAGPLDFLNLVRNAELVCTDSYHGTVFSIIYNRQFYTVLSEEKYNDERINSVLSLFGLLDRKIHVGEDTGNKTNIEFSFINRRVEEERAYSKKLLNDAIEKCLIN